MTNTWDYMIEACALCACLPENKIVWSVISIRN